MSSVNIQLCNNFMQTLVLVRKTGDRGVELIWHILVIICDIKYKPFIVGYLSRYRDPVFAIF